MRILHVIPQFPYFGRRTIVGGHASCLLTLALAQHRGGEQVTILSHIPGHVGPRQIDDGPKSISLFASAKTHTVSFGLRFWREATRWIGNHSSAFDVIHVHSGYADYFLVSAALQSKSGLPTAHTMYCPLPSSGGRWRYPGVHKLIRRWANRLDWCGGISQNVAASMSHYGIERAEAVRPALDVARFAPQAIEKVKREKLGLNNGELVVLFVGNAKPQKNAIGVLRAINVVRRRFPNVRLVITTELKHSSSDADLARLAQEARRLRLESSIIQMGIVDDMPSLMSACDVFVAPFLDTLGPSDYFMAALEAMASGKPVVVSNVGGMPEVISEETGMLVDPHNVDSIATGLSTYLSDADMRLRVGAHAKAFVRTHFHPESIVDSYRNIYRRMIR